MCIQKPKIRLDCKLTYAYNEHFVVLYININFYFIVID
jgi:hypothetical protein